MGLAALIALCMISSVACTSSASSDAGATDADADAKGGDADASGDADADGDAEELEDPSPLDLAVEISREGRRVDRPLLAGVDGGFAVAWMDYALEVESAKHIVMARIDNQGDLATGPTEVADVDDDSVDDDDIVAIDLIDTGEELTLWLLRVESSPPVTMLRMDHDGRLLDGPHAVETMERAMRERDTLAVARGAGVQLLLGVARVDGVRNIYCQTFSDDGGALSEAVTVAPSAVTQQFPDVAHFAGTPNFYAVFHQGGIVRGIVLSESCSVVEEAAVLYDDGSSSWQGHPLVEGDGAGGAMVVWSYSGESYTVQFLAVGLDGPQWPLPLLLLPDNRAESIDVALAGHSGRFLVAWESDNDSALSQIDSGRVDSTANTVLDVERLTDLGWGFSHPAAAATESASAVGFVGRLEGAARIFVRLLDPL